MTTLGYTGATELMRQKNVGPIIDIAVRLLLSNRAYPILLVLESPEHPLDKKWLRINKRFIKYVM